jgi:uncharacterized membrane protein
MGRLASWLCVALALCGAAFIVATAGALPERVATHFGRGGAADGWMTREAYTWTMALMQAGLPLLLLGALGNIPRRAERFVNLPHKDYWFAPERRAATAATLRGYGAAIGIATALLLAGAHAAVVDANAKSPPRLDEPVAIVALAVFATAMIVISVVMLRRFRRAPGPC